MFIELELVGECVIAHLLVRPYHLLRVCLEYLGLYVENLVRKMRTTSWLEHPWPANSNFVRDFELAPRRRVVLAKQIAGWRLRS